MTESISDLTDLEELARSHDFSGVVRVQRGTDVLVQFAQGFADGSNARPNNQETRFGVASITKGFTALTIMSLIEAGDLALDVTVHEVLEDALPNIDEAVTIAHLLAHRSGIGDYLNEEELGDIDEYIFGARSPHTLETPADYLDLLRDHPQKSTPGDVFTYNNSGYVVLSMIIEQIAGSFDATVIEHVLSPAGLEHSGFFRADGLPSNTATGYLVDGRSNVFHLPVIGAGDGGLYTTLDDLTAFWAAAGAGRIVSSPTWNHMTTSQDDAPYGLGFWLDEGDAHVWLEGMDAGVSAQSGILRDRDLTYSVLSNTSSGAWPLAKAIVAVGN